ncbi:MAG: hypothetical protein HY660_07020 [Armatimonadetes bacterium]|nr:hypothetical protein [Armatimonadota bacterium]
MDAQDLIAALVKNPNTAPFSRIKYIGRYLSEEEIAAFFNGLWVRAVECRDAGNWEGLAAYLEEYEEEAMRRFAARLTFLQSQGIPWAPLGKPLRSCRVALVTTGGFYVEGQEPYAPEDDVSWREIPRATPQERIRILHRGYDISGPQQDVNCVFPLHRFEELEAEGVVGEVAAVHYSFMGLIRNPEPLVRETAPAVARRLKEAAVDAVFLTST